MDKIKVHMNGGDIDVYPETRDKHGRGCTSLEMISNFAVIFDADGSKTYIHHAEICKVEVVTNE